MAQIASAHNSNTNRLSGRSVCQKSPNRFIAEISNRNVNSRNCFVEISLSTRNRVLGGQLRTSKGGNTAGVMGGNDRCDRTGIRAKSIGIINTFASAQDNAPSERANTHQRRSPPGLGRASQTQNQQNSTSPLI